MVNDLPRLYEPMGDWARHGLCGQKVAAGEADPSWWFPSSNKEMRLINLAKKICGECSVQTECLEWACRHEQYGIWGGVGPRQRELLASNRLVPCRFCQRMFPPRSMNTVYCGKECAAGMKAQRKREAKFLEPVARHKDNRCLVCDKLFVDPNGQKMYCSNACKCQTYRKLAKANKLKETTDG